ncbi:MAG: Wzz/FepE/Etk N-terminal domain-containing protein, partial [Bacillota bacterium]
MEDEINLRDLIEVLLRGKWLIAAVTLAAVACAAV